MVVPAAGLDGRGGGSVSRRDARRGDAGFSCSEREYRCCRPPGSGRPHNTRSAMPRDASLEGKALPSLVASKLGGVLVRGLTKTNGPCSDRHRSGLGDHGRGHPSSLEPGLSSGMPMIRTRRAPSSLKDTRHQILVLRYDALRTPQLCVCRHRYEGT